jgi:hypothetical protein
MVWLTQSDPALESFAAVTRDHALEYLTAMAEDPTPRTGRPLSALSRIGQTSALSMFFRDTAAWQWPDVPGHALLGAGDRPKAPTRVRRFIPADELEPLMAAIAELQCPQQRAALLVARWCGARQGEIRRLAIDWLDRYPGPDTATAPAGRKDLPRAHGPAARAGRRSAARSDRAAPRRRRARLHRRTHRPRHALSLHAPRQAAVVCLPSSALRSRALAPKRT